MSTNSVTNQKLIVCDTNIVVRLYLFKSQLMITHNYSFGSIEIDVSVIKEIQNWIDKKNSKMVKFGEPVLQSILQLCDQQTGRLREPTEQEMKSSKAYLRSVENSLPATNGSSTSDTDKRLLTMAWKNKAHIITMDQAVRNTAQRSLPSGSKLLSFHDLVTDLHTSNFLTEEEIQLGLDTLNRYNEDLDEESETQILKLIRK